jgi:uncharacterized protein (TIGR02246 family)
MKKPIAVVLTIGLITVIAASHIRAQNKPEAAIKPSGRDADEAAIRDTSQALARAFEKGDAKEVAGFWTSEGEYVDEGSEPVHGRDALEKAYSGFFAKRPELKVESRTDSIRFLGTDSAIEEGTFTVKTKDVPPDSSRFSTLYVREGGRWRIAMLKEWADDATFPPSLESLAWLIGTWESGGEEMTARVTYEWTETKAFIRSKFVITPKKGDAKPSSGTQVIGVDPAEGVIRAWTFDPDGGSGEAVWEWNGTRWSIDSAGTLASGSRTAALNFMTPAGKDSFTWRSVRRTLDGDEMPDIDAVKVNRVVDGK